MGIGIKSARHHGFNPVLTLWQVDGSQVAQLTPQQGLSLLFLGLGSGLLGFFSWNKALAMGGIAKIGQLQLLQTFFSYGVAVWFMGERWDWLSVTVCVLVVLCVFQTQKAARLANNHHDLADNTK